MRIQSLRLFDVEIDSVFIRFPMDVREYFCYGTYTPHDLPFWKDGYWEASVATTGQIRGWSDIHKQWFSLNREFLDQGILTLSVRVEDRGCYRLHTTDSACIINVEKNYVPGFVLGDFSNHVEFEINADGVIVNFEKNLEEFVRNYCEDAVSTYTSFLLRNS